ncbi:MAG: hypothetical protein ACLFT6_07165 [Bacteroidales bacterium]
MKTMEPMGMIECPKCGGPMEPESATECGFIYKRVIRYLECVECGYQSDHISEIKQCSRGGF